MPLTFYRMHAYRGFLFVISALVGTSAAWLQAQEPIVFANQHGAAITFAEAGGAWNWINLSTPGGPPGGWPVADRSVEIATSIGAGMSAADWSLHDATPEKLIFEQHVATAGVRLRRIFLFGPASNAL